jgi:DNA-binding transcriptional MerR regulator
LIEYNFGHNDKGTIVALLDNNKDILPLSSIAELLNAKLRTLKMYEEKHLFPQKTESKKLYSINDVRIISFVHYLASVKKINANGIRFIIDMIDNDMEQDTKESYLSIVEEKMEKISGKDVTDIEEL